MFGRQIYHNYAVFFLFTQTVVETKMSFNFGIVNNFFRSQYCIFFCNSAVSDFLEENQNCYYHLAMAFTSQFEVRCRFFLFSLL